jgi:exopolysaccharide biosynthesis polyprenyl glycosylphosphotransferase
MRYKNKIHFEVSERKVLLRVIDVLIVLAALYLAGNVLNFDYLNLSSPPFYYVLLLALYLNLVGTVFEMYNLQVASNQFQILKNTILTASLTVLFYLLTPVLAPQLPSKRLEIVVFYLTVVLSLLAWRMFYVAFLASNRFVQNVILVCDKAQLEDLVSGLENADPHYRIMAYVNTEKTESSEVEPDFIPNIKTEDLFAFVKEHVVFEIIIASKNPEKISNLLSRILIRLLESGNTIREYAKVYEYKTQRIPVQLISKDFYRFFPFSRSNSNQLYLWGISLFEKLISILGLVFCAALIPFILIGNAIGNRGKLFYTQERVGKNGRLFQIYKFRTMVSNAESGKAVFSNTRDKRVTFFGKFLRKTRIDEFPQFLNILIGDMAVIGPRPERPFFVKEISTIMPFYEIRHTIKPGLSGWAQVNYSYGESIEDSIVKLQYDLYYIKHRSIFLDINIMIKTLSTVLFYRGQ